MEMKSSNKLYGSTTSCIFYRGNEANLTSSAFLMQVLGVRVYFKYTVRLSLALRFSQQLEHC